MFSHNMNSRNAWNDFYNTQQPTPINKQTYGSRLSSSSESVYVSNCLFRSINSASDGGALSCINSVVYFLTESSSFSSCITSGRIGGAIYFYNTNDGQSALYEVCFNNCYSTNTTLPSRGQSAYMCVKDNYTSKNYVNYSSIVRCATENSSSWFTLYLGYGKHCCVSINSSMNKCGYRSGIHCIPFFNSTSVTCSLSYSSFADNNASVSGCIKLERGGAKYEVKSCIVLRNTQVDLDSEGTIIIFGNTTIEDSCILENKATYIFFIQSSSYTTIFSNCLIDSTSNNQNLTIQNTVSKCFVLELSLMSTHDCHAEYVSHSTKKVICNTYKIIHHQARISDFFSLSCVFMITFIQQNPSGDCFY
jgi:hypothetical protein